MTYSALIYTSRKVGTTPEQFRAHYESSHVPLVKEITGAHYPISHTRRYIQRTAGKAEGTERNANFPASVLIGTQADFEYDAIAELTFKDVGAFQTFFSIAQQPENAARITADEEKFLDRSMTTAVVVGETLITTR
ncbi:hypothetical protein VM1G_02939 [Cytospora mali]|uniref:EthD domain-containing protein n=1 Tax=Cytospora mali TaxID=578113 RepID=A0A194VUU1_CYTMA|nr:hypothetical protein VM1G_02939 [Valsa mali]